MLTNYLLMFFFQLAYEILLLVACAPCNFEILHDFRLSAIVIFQPIKYFILAKLAKYINCLINENNSFTEFNIQFN